MGFIKFLCLDRPIHVIQAHSQTRGDFLQYPRFCPILIKIIWVGIVKNFVGNIIVEIPILIIEISFYLDSLSQSQAILAVNVSKLEPVSKFELKPGPFPF